ncbi:hypothetical protein J5J10_07575 [Ciceribacter sp. L1K23]|uniref:darcynin family protein n=1 Tax=Ciceribacter sp. L1K23 TaxID=2820276 RepID=UPI001B825687|nr:darcynin family protein [Ciceribacter sp. L1K23]MBR0555539.1 hypothetical protein [Ciceribacter sp. L1K23]
MRDCSQQDELTVFVLVRALPSWLALPREQRRRIGQEAVPVETGISVRQFDSEAFTTLCSDIWMVSVPSVRTLHAIMERLRDTPLFAVPYFEQVAILAAIENGWQRYEGEMPQYD